MGAFGVKFARAYGVAFADILGVGTSPPEPFSAASDRCRGQHSSVRRRRKNLGERARPLAPFDREVVRRPGRSEGREGIGVEKGEGGL